MLYQFSKSKFELYPYVMLWFKESGRIYDLTPELEKKEYARLVEFDESIFVKTIEDLDDGFYAFNLETKESYYCEKTEWSKSVEKWIEYYELAKNNRNFYERMFYSLPKFLQSYLSALGFGG